MRAMKKLVLAWLLPLALYAACAGDDDPSESKAFGAACTVVADADSNECDSGVCTNTFDQIGHPVCSQKCPAGDATNCPDGADGTKKCNMKGYCKP
jgi:hypothetical protein